MKILEMFGEPLSNGGQESYLFNTLAHMDQTGLKIDILTPYYADNHRYIKQIEDRGGVVYSFGLPFNPGGSRWNIFKPLNELLKKNVYDCIHIHSGSIFALMVGALAAKKNRVKKIIVHSHAAGDLKGIKYYLIKFIASVIFQYSNVIYCACSDIAGEWKYSRRIVNKKMIVLKNGIDCQKFQYDEEIRKRRRIELGIENNTILVGNVGRFSKQKNQFFSVMVFENLHKKLPDSKLLLIGEGDIKKDVQKQVYDLGLTGSVIFLGNTPFVNEYLDAMDIFLFPSLYEGYPISMIEAQCNGLEVFASDSITSASKLVDNVIFMSLNKSPEDWARHIFEKGKFTRNKENSKKIVHAGFDINDTAADMRKVYINEV